MKRTTETKCPLCGVFFEVTFGELHVAEGRDERVVAMRLRCPGCGMGDRVADAEFVESMPVEEQQWAVEMLCETVLRDLADEAEDQRVDERRRGCCGAICYSDGKFTCSNGATGQFHGKTAGRLTVALPGCAPFDAPGCNSEPGVFTIEAARVVMRAVNAVSPEVACSILDVPGGYAAVKLGE